ncbi:MAG: hypothetical protein ACRDZ3_08780 [Acidimicrobiia bacterium]
MSAFHTTSRLRSLEGRHVSLALAGGARIDHCQLISAGRPGTATVWVFTGGADTFVPVSDVLDVWEPVRRSDRNRLVVSWYAVFH